MLSRVKSLDEILNEILNEIHALDESFKEDPRCSTLHFAIIANWKSQPAN